MNGFFTDLTNLYWGIYSFQILFFLGLILIFILEKDKQKKSIFVGYSVVILLGIYNPLTLWICRWIFGNFDFQAYYCRLFSIIPIIFVIAYAFVLVLNQIKGWKKLFLTLCLMTVIVIGGNNVYQADWFEHASNFNKVPKDVLQICKIFENSESDQIRIMVPGDLSVYMRQVNSAFSMPYDRYGASGIENQLVCDEPDVLAVLQYAKERNVSYIVCAKSDVILESFEEEGCKVLGYTDRYAVLENK